MILSGTIASTVQLQMLNNKWMQKKESGNVLSKQELNERSTWTSEQFMIADFQDQLEHNREAEKRQKIDNKIMSGGSLSPEEISYLEKNDPVALKKYRETKEEKESFIKESLGKVSEESSLMPGVKEILPKLQEEGHELIIISARGKEADELIDIVTKKFEEANLRFDRYYWKITDKIKICKEENIDIMIDDNPTTCKKMIENEIKVMYFRGIRGYTIPSNRYLMEVTNWGEVYRNIHNT